MCAIAIHVLHWVTPDFKMMSYQNRGMRAVQNWAYTREDTVPTLKKVVFWGWLFTRLVNPSILKVKNSREKPHLELVLLIICHASWIFHTYILHSKSWCLRQIYIPYIAEETLQLKYKHPSFFQNCRPMHPTNWKKFGGEILAKMATRQLLCGSQIRQQSHLMSFEPDHNAIAPWAFF